MTRTLPLVVASFAMAPALSAQCAPTWSGLASPADGVVGVCFATANGDLVVGGAFQNFAGVVANHVVRRTGTTWTALGSGLNGPVGAIVEMPNGDLVVGGGFSQAGNTPAANVARWNGSTWSAVGGGTDHIVTSLAVRPNGELVAGGFFSTAGGVPATGIARWNGTTWSPLGQGAALPVSAIALRPNGDVAFTSFDGVFGSITRLDLWNGTSVTNMLTLPQASFLALRTLANGDLALGGAFATIGSIPTPGLARWNGSTWAGAPLDASSTVLAIAEMPDGDLAVGGRLMVGGSSVRVARIDGASAVALEGPVPFPANFYGAHSLASLDQGQLAIGGQFAFLGTTTTPYFAMLDATCPAAATPFGAGCVGSGGLNQLTATARPWLGGTFRSRATGLANNSLVALVTGFTQFAIPLAAVFAPAGVGCVGYVAPDWIDVALPSGGVVDGQLPIPANPALVGVVFHQYALPLEFDALGNLVAITSSNGLAMAIGSF